MVVVSRNTREPKYRLVLVGSCAVGKTSISKRYCHGNFYESYSTTIGIDFEAKTVPLGEGRGSVKIQIWDTAGQERYAKLIPSYVRDSAVAFVVFDITKRDTFTNVIKENGWIDEVKNIGKKPSRPDLPIVLVANKCDLPETEHIVTKEELEAVVANKKLLGYFIVSAKNNIGIDDMFLHVCRLLPSMDDAKVPERTIQLAADLSDTERRSRCGCRQS